METKCLEPHCCFSNFVLDFLMFAETKCLRNFTPFSYLLFIKVRIGKILLVLLISKKSYPEKTQGGGVALACEG